MMEFLKNIKIKTRFFAWISILAVFFALILLVNYVYINKLRNVFEEVKVESDEFYIIIDTVEAINRVDMFLHDFLIMGATPESKENFNELSKKVLEKINILEIHSLNYSEESVMFGKIKNDYLFFETKGADTISGFSAEGFDALRRIGTMNELDNILRRIKKEIDVWRKFNTDEIAEAEQEVLDIQKELIYVNFGVMAFAVFTFAVFMIFLSRSIGRSVGNLLAAAKKISAGNLRARAEIETQDEIGELAKEFNKMAADLESAQTRQKKHDEEMEKTLREMKIINRAMIGRELAMIELKKKLKKAEEEKN